jgi:hypothetical protein
MCLSLSELLIYLFLYIGLPAAFVIFVGIYLYRKMRSSAEHSDDNAERMTEVKDGR